MFCTERKRNYFFTRKNDKFERQIIPSVAEAMCQRLKRFSTPSPLPPSALVVHYFYHMKVDNNITLHQKSVVLGSAVDSNLNFVISADPLISNQLQNRKGKKYYFYQYHIFHNMSVSAERSSYSCTYGFKISF